MDTLEKLEEKITKAVALIERLTLEKNAISEENSRLRAQLAEIESKLARIETADSGKSDRIKTKLNGILEKLGTLEQM